MPAVIKSIYLGNYRTAVEAALGKMQSSRVVARIREKDHTLWKPSPAEITNRLGWLDSPREMMGKISEIETVVTGLRGDGYSHALLLGMGGSSLAPEVFRRTFGVKPGYLDLAVLDSTDPGAVLACIEPLDLTKTLFIVSTKSGGTVETFSLFKYCYNLAVEAMGAGEAGKHFIAITDPGSSLANTAGTCNFRKVFLNNPDIGGRYSALSYFGLFPAALIGMDINVLLNRARAAADNEYAESEKKNADSFNLSGAYLGAVLGELAKAGRDKATFILSREIESFGNWLEQLLAESTGKEGRGILPVVGEPLGNPYLYGNDRVFIFIHLNGDEADNEKARVLSNAGHPLLRIQIQDLYDLGEQCFLWEMATAVAGHILAINPFDQPNVETSKALARMMIDAYIREGSLPVEIPLLSAEGIRVYGSVQGMSLAEALTLFLGQFLPGDYVALQAYIQPTPETDTSLLTMRMRLRDKYRLATTVGYGPRYLHSTGQLHKGDRGRGLFIQFTADDARDIPIPDRAGKPDAALTFGILKAAQSLGDGQALISAGRPVLRFHLGKDVINGLKILTAAL